MGLVGLRAETEGHDSDEPELSQKSVTVVRLIKLHRGGRNLDLGCGSGRYADCFSGYTVGLEFDPVKAHRAKAKYQDVVVGSADRLPFRDKVFDFLLCTEVVEHLVAKRAWNALGEISRASRRALVTTPNRNLLFTMLSKAFYGTERSDHLSFWKPSDLRARGWKVRGCLGLVTWHRLRFEPIRQIWNRLAWVAPDLLGGDLVGLK